MLTIIARTTFKSVADRDTMVTALTASAIKTVQEPGVICYQLSVDPIDPLILNAVEIYRDLEAVEAHVTSEHMKTMLAAIAEVEADTALRAFEGAAKPFDLSSLPFNRDLASHGKISLTLQ